MLNSRSFLLFIYERFPIFLLFFVYSYRYYFDIKNTSPFDPFVESQHCGISLIPFQT